MKEQLAAALRAYAPEPLEAGAMLEAAVLVLLYEHEGEPHLVFQKRSEFVLHHKGQISFPGGAVDPGDESPEYTALRETHEEVGLPADRVEVLGRLDDIITISGFRVTPIVGWFERAGFEWNFSNEEVAYLLEVPLSGLADPANFVVDRRVIDGREAELPSYRAGDDLIWGATARILTNFLDVATAAGAMPNKGRGVLR